PRQDHMEGMVVPVGRAAIDDPQVALASRNISSVESGNVVVEPAASELQIGGADVDVTQTEKIRLDVHAKAGSVPAIAAEIASPVAGEAAVGCEEACHLEWREAPPGIVMARHVVQPNVSAREARPPRPNPEVHIPRV